MKLEIQKVFTKIRSALNEREDYLILEVDKQYENAFFNEDIIKELKKVKNSQIKYKNHQKHLKLMKRIGIIIN